MTMADGKGSAQQPQIRGEPHSLLKLLLLGMVVREVVEREFYTMMALCKEKSRGT